MWRGRNGERKQSRQLRPRYVLPRLWSSHLQTHVAMALALAPLSLSQIPTVLSLSFLLLAFYFSVYVFHSPLITFPSVPIGFVRSSLASVFYLFFRIGPSPPLVLPPSLLTSTRPPAPLWPLHDISFVYRLRGSWG